jgi:hypothetical protein
MEFEFLQVITTHTEKLSQWLEAQRIPYMMHEQVLWYSDRNMIQPLAPFHQQVQLDEDLKQELFARFDAGLIRWYGRVDQRKLNGFDWYVVGKQYQACLADLKPLIRKEIESGLRMCDVRRVDASYLARNACMLLHKTNNRIQHADQLFLFERDDDFSSLLLQEEPFDQFIHYFGVFYESRLVGFARCMIMSAKEVHLTHLMLDPEYLRFRSAEALVWHITEYYLNESRFTQVVSGSKPWDQTEQGDAFFVESLGFEKTPMQLHVQFRRKIHQQISFMQPVRKIYSSFSPDLNKVHHFG